MRERGGRGQTSVLARAMGDHNLLVIFILSYFQSRAARIVKYIVITLKEYTVTACCLSILSVIL